MTRFAVDRMTRIEIDFVDFRMTKRVDFDFEKLVDFVENDIDNLIDIVTNDKHCFVFRTNKK